ncbi:PREDICTED: lipase maturation factor 1-like [Amphimedon queenslandica]|uniref:Lipase maturation factor n=2 Tax=Amphimedon queenslandica TaxID=400682 RepID=A0AAN0JM49_AMPQE|nr:PREDICTED: lipase maturation factor 1-like [Amphimedon queenslandica]|eukprot:XP_019858081.1 PREDICTED: lipase maturation factor 1-like [Amphimedon queenslandica]
MEAGTEQSKEESSEDFNIRKSSSSSSVDEDERKLLAGSYWLVRILFIRSFSAIYFVAFLIALYQNKQLLGRNGLLPIHLYLQNIQKNIGSESSWKLMSFVPTLFWWVPEEYIDISLDSMATVGLVVSGTMVFLGAGNVIMFFILWGLYQSLSNVGQRWYSFGWESQLLEMGFLAMFLSPVLSLSQFPRHTPTSWTNVWGNRWMIFRIMIGAGLIKMRGDSCWRDLTCMNYHYEVCAFCVHYYYQYCPPKGYYIRKVVSISLGLLLAYLSIPVVQNLLSSRQQMNTSFEPLRIINTYGAFGSVTKERTEVIIEGTYDFNFGKNGEGADWEEIEFNCKPGNVSRRPCIISPYHYRLDWLMWFAAFQSYQHNPWLLHFCAKLLAGDPSLNSLIAHNPFKEKPPNFVRALHYQYKYTKIGSKESKRGQWWKRKKKGVYLPIINIDSLKDIMSGQGWKWYKDSK